MKALRLKTYHFHTKLPYQKPILRQITQPANIGSQDVPRDVSKWRPRYVRFWRRRDVPGRLIRDVPTTFSGCPLEDLENASEGWCGVICWKFLSLFFLLFFRNLFDLSNLSKSNSILKVYLEPSWTSKMELFGEIGWWLLAVNYFRERTSSQKLDWGLNTLLILFSNVVWHGYRSIAETKIFRFGASLICPFYVKKENWIVKKLYYRKVKYVTSNTENFKLHLQ